MPNITFPYSFIAAYRKLPFELGPLPPAQPDCCILSKISEIKAANGIKSKRSAKQARVRSQQRDRSDSATENSKDATTSGGSSGGICSTSGPETLAVDTTSSTITRSMPRLLSALTEPSRRFTSSMTPVSNQTSTCTTDDDALSERRSKSRKSSVSSKLGVIDTFPAAIGNKKKTILLDAFGQPRKSPREHASTLAILSTIVQQRRKRFKELNGGISPEKMPTYMQANGLADLTDEDDCDNDSCATKNTDNCDHFDQNSHGSDSNSKLDIKQLCDKNDDVVISSEAEGDSMSEPTGHKFLLRKGIRRQMSGLAATSNEDSTKATTISRKATPIPPEDGDDDDNTQKEFKYPKMPVDDYVDPNVVARQLDAVLSECYKQVTNELSDFPLKFDEDQDPSDLVLVSTPKDFVEMVSTVKEGPLSYRTCTNTNNSGLSSFMKGKKRRNNRTGWPSVPKRRTMIKREKRNGSAVDEAGTLSNTEDDDTTIMAATTAVETDGDRIDISSHLLQDKVDEYFIQSRQRSPSGKIKQENESMDEDETVNANGDKDDYEDYDDDDDVEPFINANDNAINNVFTSSSEKAENSDIFTVSSDSLDTADLTTDRTGGNVSKRKTTVNADKDDDESTNDTDDSSSDATTIAEIIPKKKKSELKPTQMETRGKGDRINILTKHNNRLTLQPVVCVKKICEKDLYRRTYGRSASTSPQKSKESPSKPVTMNSASSRNSCSPRSKISPRKLRKPRGRYYKES